METTRWRGSWASQNAGVAEIIPPTLEKGVRARVCIEIGCTQRASFRLPRDAADTRPFRLVGEFRSFLKNAASTRPRNLIMILEPSAGPPP